MRDNIPYLVFMYGYPASGKTVTSKSFYKSLQRMGYEVYLISADRIREELYGSQDCFGDGEEIYKKILKKMKECLDNGVSVIYDACNLYRSFRMDYLNELKDYECYRGIIRVNTPKDICIKNHEERDRNFSLDNIMHYFDINEYPDLEEGWDEIVDYSWAGDYQKFFIASPFFTKQQKDNLNEISEFLRSKGHEVNTPLSYKYDYQSNLKDFFDKRIEELDETELVIALNYSLEAKYYNSWEIGFAYGSNYRIILTELENESQIDYRLKNSWYKKFTSLEDLKKYLEEEYGK